MFQLVGIDPGPFAHLFTLSDDELASRGIKRCLADKPGAFPCRVSLTDAEPGQELLLLHHEHHAADSPYRASGPIFLSRAGEAAMLAPMVVPPYVTTRLISVRAYDARHMMIDAEVVEGRDVRSELVRMLSNANVEYIHLHNARRGCFSCAVRRC